MMRTREIKHYFGRFSGRLAGIPSWRGGHYYTSDYHVQQKIENHPLYLAGIIETIADKPPKKEDRSTSVDLDTMPWVEVLKLARSLGFDVKGKKRADLVAEMKEQ